MTGDTEALADSIAGCFSNVSDLPEWMQVEALGRSMRPLTEIAARAVLVSDWLAAHDERVRAEERERIYQRLWDARYLDAAEHALAAPKSEPTR